MQVSEALISLEEQTLFDHVVRKLTAQGQRCGHRENGYRGEAHFRCLYREGERRCALGHCFTEKAHAVIPAEAGSLKVLVADNYLEFDVSSKSSRLKILLAGMQSAHDDAKTRYDFRKKMIEIGKAFQLDLGMLQSCLTDLWVLSDSTW